jgi:hypothetical protein
MMAAGAGWLPILVACTLVAFRVPGMAADGASHPTFSLLDSDITIESGATEGRGAMLLKADNLDAARLAQPLGMIDDLQALLPPPGQIHRPRARPRR